MQRLRFAKKFLEDEPNNGNDGSDHTQRDDRRIEGRASIAGRSATGDLGDVFCDYSVPISHNLIVA